MTIIQLGTKIWITKYTQNTLELSELLGWDIPDKEFKIGSYPSISTVRGYCVVALAGTGTIDRGPITLTLDDIEEVTYEKDE